MEITHGQESRHVVIAINQGADALVVAGTFIPWIGRELEAEVVS
jgi:hypothetical protein